MRLKGLTGVLASGADLLDPRGLSQPDLLRRMTAGLDATKGAMREMRYTIVFGTKNTHGVSAADATTAREALAITEALQSQDCKIKFIRSPQEGEFGVEMLRLLAKEEEEEMRIAPD